MAIKPLPSWSPTCDFLGHPTEKHIMLASLILFGPRSKIAPIPPIVGLQCSTTGGCKGLLALGADSMQDAQGVGLGDGLACEEPLATHRPSAVPCKSSFEVCASLHEGQLHGGERAPKDEVGPRTPPPLPGPRAY